MDQSSRSEGECSDAQIRDAIAGATNWRDVMRALGLRDNSAGAIRIIKRHAVRLGLDTSHFRGKRGWSDAQLRRAVIDARSWDELPELIDWFFIMDGDLTIYLIPSMVIAGRITILLHTYTKYIVGSAAGFMTPRPGAA